MNHNVYGFIGLGLIGGSLALALKRMQPDCRIMAYTRSRATSQSALEAHAIDVICSAPDDPQFGECSFIFLCAPVGTNIRTLKILKDVVSPDCILTDVSSVKTDIHIAADLLELQDRFIGGHPMTGSEKTGFSNANEHLFENSYYIITPSEEVSEQSIDQYRSLVSGIGAIPLILDYKQHDYCTAAVSHLPHLIAVSLVNTVHDLDSKDQLMKLLAAGGFKDITRIASSSPEMWEHICISNCDNISDVMDTFISLLESARTAMHEGRGSDIYRAFERSRDYRNSFSSSSPGTIKRAYNIYCDIIDEAGAIATIATILAVNNISIKNIGIVHNREFDEGVLRIEFYEESTSLHAAELLRQRHYQVWVR